MEADSKWLNETEPVFTLNTTGQFEQVLENQYVLITLMMRLYDLNMAQLSFTNKEVADQLYDAHARGEHSNPQIYVPVKVEDD